MRNIAASTFLFIAFLVDIAFSFKSFSSSAISSGRSLTSLNAEEGHKKLSSWDGTRPPITRMERLEQSMDATWGRGKFRTEVWAGDVNPMNDWWMAYAPSPEEVDAAAQGFNFKDPKAWLEVKETLNPFCVGGWEYSIRCSTRHLELYVTFCTSLHNVSNSYLSAQAKGLDADAAIAEANRLKKEQFAAYLEVEAHSICISRALDEAATDNLTLTFSFY